MKRKGEKKKSYAKAVTRHLPPVAVSKQQLLWKDFPQIIAEHDVKFFFGQFGSAVPAVLPLSLSATPSLLLGAADRVRSRKRLNIVQVQLSNSKNIGVLSSTLF